MILAISILVFLLFTGGFYLVMRRNIMEVVLGVLLLSHGTNLLIVSMGGWAKEEVPPITTQVGGYESIDYADPLPHALVLTAIVIGFGVTAFLIVLILRGYEETESMEVGEVGRLESEE